MTDVTEHERETGPTRTCVGCRAKDDRDALVRLVVGPEPPFLAPDLGRRLPGRGVSVHPRRSCVVDAVKKGGLARALRGKVPLTAPELVGLISARYEARIQGLLLAATRTRALAVGTDAVRIAIREGDAQLLVVAADAAGRREEIIRAAERLGRACVVFGDKSSIGALLGRDEVGVVAVLDQKIAVEVASAARCVTALSEDE